MNKKITELGKFFASCKVTRVKNEGANVLELKDVEDTSVVFECENEEDIAEGTKATPDGVFTFANGKKITIEDGVVTAIEVVKEEEIKKDSRIAELEAENNDLKKENEELITQVEKLEKQLEDKEEEVKVNNQRLAKLESFAKALQDEGEEHKEVHENKKSFSFKRK